MARPVVLTYHKVGDQFELAITTVSVRSFMSHLDLLPSLGGRLVAASEAVLVRPEGAIALTFDDGYECVYTHAFPEMVSRAMTGTVFPIVGSVGGPNLWDVRLSPRPFRHASWSQLLEMSRHGFEIGSHTVSHRDLTKVDTVSLRCELRASKREIEDHIGVAVNCISYPFGRYSDRVVNEAIDAGYTCGFGSVPNHSASRMTAGRIAVHRGDGLASLKRKTGVAPGLGLEGFKTRLAARLSLGTSLVKRNSGHGGWRG